VMFLSGMWGFVEVVFVIDSFSVVERCG
jgi:hypothetical protein